MSERCSRWAARNSAKAAVRNRVWSRLVETGVSVGPAFDRIPNFVGADAAAKTAQRARAMEAGARRQVQSRSAANPGPPEGLYDGKLLFSPVPHLTQGFPYLRIDPDKLAAKGVDFETAATSQGFMQHRRAGRLRGHAEARLLRRRLRRGHAARRPHRQGRGLRRSRTGRLSRARPRRFLDADCDDGPFLASGRRLPRSSWRATIRRSITLPPSSS